MLVWILKGIPFLMTLTKSVLCYRVISLARLFLSLNAIFASMARQNLNAVSLGMLVFDVELVALDSSVLPSAILSIRISHQWRLRGTLFAHDPVAEALVLSRHLSDLVSRMLQDLLVVYVVAVICSIRVYFANNWSRFALLSQSHRDNIVS